MEEKIREKNRTSTERIANCEFSVRFMGLHDRSPNRNRPVQGLGRVCLELQHKAVFFFFFFDNNIKQFYNLEEQAFKSGFL